MDFMRKRISRLQHVRNETIKREIDLQWTVIEEIEPRRLKWYGHMRRIEDSQWPKKTWKWQPHQRKKKRQTESRMEYPQIQKDQWEDKKAWRLGCKK
ncbi:hypothetical protein ILUMI_24118 [Ignelater luminosus]|uniref:Uncharacterized protein n=1 Tax=Ignelater luminosus TaxID=2038154 RepID=A0A8K0C7L2_IGNLU|nr:hypothetical protein ILUMI_24118 [Ignelater luminosus]